MSDLLQKQALRTQCKTVIAQETAQQRATLSAKIAQHVLQLPQYQRAQSVFCFVARYDEIDTTAILQDALCQGKALFVPRCVGKGVMQACQITSLSDLALGAYGILEPKENAPTGTVDALDCCILPCIAMDAKGNRLGYGAGFYDRFLSQATHAIAAIALCRSALLLPTVPAQPHDIAVQTIVTEQGAL